MRMPRHSNISLMNAIGLAVLVCLAPLARAQAAETITATAKVKTAGGTEATAPVKITIERFSTNAERAAILDALKNKGTEGLRSLLATRTQVGTIQVGGQTTPLKYISTRTTAGGRLITGVSGSPIAFVGAGAPGAKPKAGFDLGLVIVEVAASGGHGELMPATKVKLDDKGAIVTDDYSDEVVQLTNIGK
jgi:hypothetical protein